MEKEDEIRNRWTPRQSPLFHAQQRDRYERQELIRDYQDKFSCRLIVVIDAIFPENTTLFEELVYDADPEQDLHIILVSPGGDGETAVRLARSAQARCNKLTVILPDQAKSAATLFAISAHEILWGPAGDLGPIDPQFVLNGELVSARSIIESVNDAAAKVQASPATYPIYASLLTDVNAIMVQQARSEMARSEELLLAALVSNPDRTEDDAKELLEALKSPLITTVTSHGAVFGPMETAQIEGFPSVVADTNGLQWQMIWRLWTKYYAIEDNVRIYEGERQSHVLYWDDEDEDD